MSLDPSSHPPVPASAAVPLADLAPGARAVVSRVETTPLGRRLLDLGFVPDTAVRVLRRAPLGDPTTYELRGTRMCLRRAEARAVWVTPCRGNASDGPGGSEGRDGAGR